MGWAQPSWPIGPRPGQWSDGEDVSGPVLYGRIGRRIQDLTDMRVSIPCAGFYASDVPVLAGFARIPLGGTSNPRTKLTGGLAEAGDTILYPTPGVYLLLVRVTCTATAGASPTAFAGRTVIEWRTGSEAQGTHQIPVPATLSDDDNGFSFAAPVVVPAMSEASTFLMAYCDAAGGRYFRASVGVKRLVEL